MRKHGPGFDGNGIRSSPTACECLGPLPEALPGIVAGFTVTLVTLIGASAMAGAIGDLAIRYGYQCFETTVMIAVVVVLIVLVCAIQWLGDRLVERLDHR